MTSHSNISASGAVAAPVEAIVRILARNRRSILTLVVLGIVLNILRLRLEVQCTGLERAIKDMPDLELESGWGYSGMG